MRIGIITFHRALSYGAGFQAYALQEYLSERGHEVEIIDYVPERFSFRGMVFTQPKHKSIKEKLIQFFPYIICKTTQYCVSKRFIKRFLAVSKKCNIDDLAKQNLDYDVYITGSDQVWNLKFDSIDNIKPYLLDFASKKARKISYASSIGMDSFNDIDLNSKERFAEELIKYDNISVREKHAVSLLSEFGIDAQCVLDPTFLIPKEKWEEIAIAPKSRKKYVFVYGLYRNKQLYAFANNLAKKHGFSVINMADSYDFNLQAKNKIVVTHEKLLGYIANAECVVTDSFHGTAISVNMGKPLFVFPAPRYNTRLESLIELLGLQERYLKDKELCCKEIDMDYTLVRYKLDEEKEKSYAFLEKALEGK